jgi:predicted secreted hydrolase
MSQLRFGMTALVLSSSVGCTDAPDLATTEHALRPNGTVCQIPPPASPFLSLPADEAPHPAESGIEYWAHAGELKATTGETYSFEAFFAQVQVAPGQFVRVAQGGVLDHATGVFHQTGSAPTPGTFPQTVNGYDLDLPGFGASGGAGVDTALAFDVGDGTELSLSAINTKAPLFSGEGGLLDYDGEGFWLEYGTLRNRAQGTLEIGGQTKIVSGVAQEAHGWGGFPFISYERLTIRLDSQRELFLYVARRFQTNEILEKFGHIVDTDCSVTALDGDDFTITESGAWTSPHSGSTYPLGFVVDIPQQALHLEGTRVARDQEIHWPNPFFQPFVIGATRFTGRHHGEPVSGSGIVEIAGR